MWIITGLCDFITMKTNPMNQDFGLINIATNPIKSRFWMISYHSYMSNEMQILGLLLKQRIQNVDLLDYKVVSKATTDKIIQTKFYQVRRRWIWIWIAYFHFD